MDSDLRPPRMFNTVTSPSVTYNLDTVEYLVKQELERRRAAQLPPLSDWELGEYRRQVLVKLVIHGDAEAAINLRPRENRKLLLEQ